MDKQTILIIAGLIIILILVNFLHSDFFQVTEIQVKGCDLLTPEYLKSYAGVKEKANIFAVDSQGIKEKLLNLPQLKEVAVFRDLPDKLVIEVKEREPRAVIFLDDVYYLIDSKGWLLQVVDNLAAQEKPVITGVEIEKKENERLEVTSSLSKIMVFLKGLSDSSYLKIEEITVSELGTVAFLEEGGRVKLGEEFSPSKKAAIFASVYEDLKAKNLEIDYIDLRDNRYCFVKPK